MTHKAKVIQALTEIEGRIRKQDSKYIEIDRTKDYPLCRIFWVNNHCKGCPVSSEASLTKTSLTNFSCMGFAEYNGYLTNKIPTEDALSFIKEVKRCYREL